MIKLLAWSLLGPALRIAVFLFSSDSGSRTATPGGDMVMESIAEFSDGSTGMQGKIRRLEESEEGDGGGACETGGEVDAAESSGPQ
ncbi:hypothetical protein GW17_00045874 [Ensete ventricosum]|nr:hypothetical protein GW17_00045874 [Ensete ventricosum]RZR80237.1 hypothetical protein BHM03_00006207 [Ensete ventricosum]